MRPIIGIAKSGKKFNPAYWAIWFSVFISGAKPVGLPPQKGIFTEIDGLVLGGGSDIFPGLFSLEPKQGYKYDSPRDQSEISWLTYAREKQIPVLGICRGAQLLNVADGGSLHMNVSEAYDDAVYPDDFFSYIFFRKLIAIKSGSLLEGILKKDSAKVNSMHKQSISSLGSGLQVTAQEPNGVIQAIENPDRDFYMGLQFHPELMIHESEARKIFSSFVRACKKDKNERVVD